jgi:hypothetical protein
VNDVPLSAVDLRVAADHSQIYVYSDAELVFDEDDDDDNPYLDALDDAVESGRFVGACRGLLDLMTPGQWNFDTPMRVEIWAAEPAGDLDDWQHEVDADLDVPDGRLVFEASGGGAQIPVEIPAGSYRVRVSGAGYGERRQAGADGDDHYRLRMWPRTGDSEPVLRKYWSGWDSYA